MLPFLSTVRDLYSTSASARSRLDIWFASRNKLKAPNGWTMHYILDVDSTPDKCTDPIRLLGVQHPGYKPSAEPASPALSRRGFVDSRQHALNIFQCRPSMATETRSHRHHPRTTLPFGRLNCMLISPHACGPPIALNRFVTDL